MIPSQDLANIWYLNDSSCRGIQCSSYFCIRYLWLHEMKDCAQSAMRVLCPTINTRPRIQPVTQMDRNGSTYVKYRLLGISTNVKRSSVSHTRDWDSMECIYKVFRTDSEATCFPQDLQSLPRGEAIAQPYSLELVLGSLVLASLKFAPCWRE